MSDKIYDVPAEWKKRAYIDDAKYQEMYARSIKDPNGFWAEQAKRIALVSSRPPRSRTPRFGPATSRSNGSRTASLNVAYNCIDRHLAQARRPDRDHLGGRRPEGLQAHHLSGAARRGLPVRQRPAQPQRREGRPRHHLHADDPGGGLRDARLRAHRRDPFGGVRRLLAGLARRPHRGLRVERRHHRRRRRARRPQGAAEGQRRRGASPRSAASITSSSCSAPAATVDMEPVRDVWYHEAAEVGDRRVPVRAR